MIKNANSDNKSKTENISGYGKYKKFSLDDLIISQLETFHHNRGGKTIAIL